MTHIIKCYCSQFYTPGKRDQTEEGKNLSKYRREIFVAFVEDKTAMSSIRYFETRISYFVQNRRK